MQCPLCNGSVEKNLATELRRGKGQVKYCMTCDHGFLVKTFHSDPKEYYAEKYRQEYSHNAESTATNAKEIFDVYKNYQLERLSFIEPLLNPATHFLEIGASSGQFLVHIKDKVSVLNAIELDTDCCSFMREVLGINSESEFLENSTFSNGMYDIVCAFQVMEHVESPIDFLKGLRKVTKLGGYIFIEVPNISDPLLSVWNVKPYDKFYFHEAHLHYFSINSLRQVASSAGFSSENIEIFSTQDYNLLNHLHWIMNNSPQSNCHVGLSEIMLNGKDIEISQWLTQELRKLNEEYISKLIKKNKTSNIMLRLRNVV